MAGPKQGDKEIIQLYWSALYGAWRCEAQLTQGIGETQEECLRDWMGNRWPTPDGVAEALQRLIENGATLGPASSEDALLVARYRQSLLAPQPVTPASVKEAISDLLTEAMDRAVANGANSVSMPDEYVAVAAWLCGIKGSHPNWPATHTTFALGDEVRKTKGSQWRGRVVGWYSTELTPEGYAVESSSERGSVQIYPATALERVCPTQEAR